MPNYFVMRECNFIPTPRFIFASVSSSSSSSSSSETSKSSSFNASSWFFSSSRVSFNSNPSSLYSYSLLLAFKLVHLRYHHSNSFYLFPKNADQLPLRFPQKKIPFRHYCCLKPHPPKHHYQHIQGHPRRRYWNLIRLCNYKTITLFTFGVIHWVVRNMTIPIMGIPEIGGKSKIIFDRQFQAISVFESILQNRIDWKMKYTSIFLFLLMFISVSFAFLVFMIGIVTRKEW